MQRQFRNAALATAMAMLPATTLAAPPAGVEPIEILRQLMDAPPAVLEAELTHAFSFFIVADMEKAWLGDTASMIEYIVENCERLQLIDEPLHYVTLLAELWTTGETSLPIELSDQNELTGIFIGMFVPGKTQITPEVVLELVNAAEIDPASLPIEDIARLASRVQLERYGAV